MDDDVRANKEFQADCMKYRGRLLTGEFAHWCHDWDALPVDETCREWPCSCFDLSDEERAYWETAAARRAANEETMLDGEEVE